MIEVRTYLERLEFIQTDQMEFCGKKTENQIG